MRPLSATNASTSVGTNGQVTSSLVIKGNVPQTIINNSINKPNQIVHLSKINTSKLVSKNIRTLNTQEFCINYSLVMFTIFLRFED